MKASVESLEAQVEELEEENAMLKMDLGELTASSTDADFRLRQELRDAQEELERLRQQQKSPLRPLVAVAHSMNQSLSHRLHAAHAKVIGICT